MNRKMVEKFAFGLMSVSCVGCMVAAGCLYDVLPAPTACSLVPPINDCPVLPNGVDGECRSVGTGTQGFKTLQAYSVVCYYIQQYKPNQQAECQKHDPPITGFYSVQCSRAVGDVCKEHP